MGGPPRHSREKSRKGPKSPDLAVNQMCMRKCTSPNMGDLITPAQSR